MMPFIRHSAVCLSLLLLPLLLRAQEVVTVAPSIGYEYGVPLGLQRAPGVINRFGFSGDGESYNHTAWFGAEIILPGLLGDDVGLVARPTLALSNGRFTSDPFSTFGTLNRFSREQTAGTARFEVSATESAFLGDLRGVWRIGTGWRIGGGVWGGYRIASAFFQTEELLDPFFVVFPDDSRFRTVASGNQLASAPFRGGAIVTIGADVRATPWLRLRPELHGRADAGALLDGVGLRSLSAGISMSIELGGRRSFDTTAHDPLPPITAAEALRLRIAELPAPSATLDLYCIEKGERRDSCAIRSRRVRHRRFVHFPDALRFDHGSATLPASLPLLTPEQTPTFSMRSLAGLAPDSIRAQVLNVLGMRLRQHPAARVTIVGVRQSGEEETIARQRAESVRSYLEQRWQIGNGRITVRTERQTQPDGGIQIRSDYLKLIEPIATAWIDADYTMPRIGIERMLDAPGGVKRSELTISQQGNILLRTSGDDESIRELDLSFVKPDEEEKPGPIVALLSVEDYAGRVVTARDELPVTIDTVTQEEREVLTWIRPAGLTGLSAERDMAWMAATVAGMIRPDAAIDLRYPRGASSDAQEIARALLAKLDDEMMTIRELRIEADERREDIVITIEQRLNGEPAPTRP